MYSYLEIDARLCSYLYAIRLHNQLEPIDLYRLLGHEYDNPHMLMWIKNTYDKDPKYTKYLLKVIKDLTDMNEAEDEAAATKEWYIIIKVGCRIHHVLSLIWDGESYKCCRGRKRLPDESLKIVTKQFNKGVAANSQDQ